MQQLTHPGDTISCLAGDRIVQLVLTERVVRIEVLTGAPVGQLIDALSRSYERDQETLARTIARVLTVALRNGADDEGARRAVVEHLDAELAFILANNSIEAGLSGLKLQDEMLRWQTDADRARLDALVADMREFLRGRAS